MNKMKLEKTDLLIKKEKLEKENKILKKRLEDYKIAYENVMVANKMLENEISRLNNIINKAIEYLESYNTDFKNCRFGEAPISIRELGELLDILKGSDKE